MANDEAGDQAFWAWDQYWRDGRLASCGGEGGAAYQAAITEGWRRFFQDLPAGSRILDVCTGNGAVALVAEETAGERGIRFEIEAFDGAVIATPESPGSMIHFRSRVQAESLPYPDDNFEIVVSQYGLEYSDMERSLPELVRVSVPDSRVRLMVHAREGIVVGKARQQSEEAHRLLDSPIFQAARELAEGRDGGIPELTLKALKARYNEAVQQLEKASSESVEPEMYSNVCCVLTHALSIQQQVGAEQVSGKVDDVRQTVRAHAERVDAMIRASLDEAGAEALGARIGKLWGHQVEVRAGRRDNGDLLGWVIESVAV